MTDRNKTLVHRMQGSNVKLEKNRETLWLLERGIPKVRALNWRYQNQEIWEVL